MPCTIIACDVHDISCRLFAVSVFVAVAVLPVSRGCCQQLRNVAVDERLLLLLLLPLLQLYSDVASTTTTMRTTKRNETSIENHLLCLDTRYCNQLNGQAQVEGSRELSLETSETLLRVTT